MQALHSIFMSMTLYVTGKNSMTPCVTASMTLYIIAKFCMTLYVTSSISLNIGCMTQKCMTQKYRPHELPFLISVITFFGAKRAKKPLTKHSRAKLLQLIYNFHVKTPQKLACLVLLFWCLLMDQITFDYFRSDDHIICIFKHAVERMQTAPYMTYCSINKMF